MNISDNVTLQATNLEILSPDGHPLAGPLSFSLSPGHKVAIVGHSGAGKSSLLNLLLGFLPYRGSLTVNGTELKALSAEQWRQNLSWVGQNPHLPERTLRENITLSSPDASEEQIAQAVRRAYVDEFLPRFPEGLETEVGDGAARLSVGQAQRVAVARALLSPCHLLLLDEPTASLDANSERLVMAALNDAAERQTTLLVTHRLEDTARFDEIWVMDKGQIIQQGDYQTLSRSPGAFADLLSNRSVEV